MEKEPKIELNREVIKNKILELIDRVMRLVKDGRETSEEMEKVRKDIAEEIDKLLGSYEE